MDGKLLSATLTDGLRQATYFVAFVMPIYHYARWTAQEWKRAAEERTSERRRRPLRLVEVLMGGKVSGKADIVIQDKGSALAEQLLISM